MNKIKSLLVLIAIVPSCFAQNDTSTPYSLFGLGVENKTATAGLTGLGNTGIAQNTSGEINLFNPASLGNIELNTFLYEFGLNGLYSTIKTSRVSENTHDFNFSHVVIAFPLKKNLGISIGLLPYTKVGYDIDMVNAVEGSEESYSSRITGSGGLNKFYLSSGMQVLDKLSLGVDLTYLFGSITQETNLYYGTLVNITDVNYYRGLKFKAGLQYNLIKTENKDVMLGAVLELPTGLKADQERNSYKVSTGDSQIIMENAVEEELADFESPLSLGFGIRTLLNNRLSTSFDFTKLYWDDTKQTQNTDYYSDQSIYAFGLEYTPVEKFYKYWSRLNYRFGINYNTGYLNISDQKIDSYFVSAGLGIPLSGKAKLNIAYSYGKEGTVTNNLVQENFHKLTLNLSFIGNWFNKRKID